MAQPGVILLQGPSKNVLYQWALIPAASNMGGLHGRPIIAQLGPYLLYLATGEGPAVPEPRTLTKPGVAPVKSCLKPSYFCRMFCCEIMCCHPLCPPKTLGYPDPEDCGAPGARCVQSQQSQEMQ
eukprot:TRINITY_DN67534_c6_g3_i1.p1 TRINITY_DN67534_c6_g3~~TRINITY_DN67534_c6_g3_i1.p1  ORF type:complete len:125 (+),score=12.03 TRINITY_DN67534_c6_g3_i1:361-735(+)